ncbi:hypothetical protein [Actinospica sp.]|jgi:hypothetical protein|uniref:hypothetical protein n=1 Tax=Actinospica sp. TaxID=1872142 RepID=UPI002BBE44B8|nr:hypothetical protein [Actinospica sp.]HWG25134.1 hypothetical protein [Actinospica sp.]
MLLTDPALQYWSCVAAILATVAVLVLWNRVQGPAPVRVLSRTGLLIAGYLTTAVAILVSVNIAYGGLIVSVSDLFADVNPPMGQFMHSACGGDGMHGGVGNGGVGNGNGGPHEVPTLGAAAAAQPWPHPCASTSAEPAQPAQPAQPAVPAEAQASSVP